MLGRRNGDHWMMGPELGSQTGSNLPYFDAVKFNIITENSTLIATGLAGDLDTMFIPEPQFIPQIEDDANWGIVKMEGAFISEIIMMNSSKPPLDNLNLRLAIMHALHPEAVNAAVHNNLMIQALGGQWPVGTWVYDEVPSNPQVALPQLQRAQGQGAGIPRRLRPHRRADQRRRRHLFHDLHQPGQDRRRQHLRPADQGSAGHRCGVQPARAGGVHPRSLRERRVPHGRDRLGHAIRSRTGFASLAYSSTGYYNPNGPSDESHPLNPDVDQLIADARATADIEQRKSLYAKINDIVVGEGHYYTMLYGVNFTGVRNVIQNANETLFNAEGKWQTRWLYSDEA